MMDIAVDFGGTYIKIGIVNEGRIVGQQHLPAHSANGLVPRLGEVRHAVFQLLESNNMVLSDCSGIGIAMPGIVHPGLAKVLSINGKYADAIDFTFTEWARAEFGLPFIMENDAKAALIGEVSYGVGCGATDIVSVVFGTGIGTAAMMNGQLVRGKHHQAGCLGGHFVVNAFGRDCSCGNRGCAEAHASHFVLDTIARSRNGFAESSLARTERVDYLSLVESVRNKDPFGTELLDELVTYWSAAIINLIHAYDPDVVLLSGPLMKSKEVFLDQLVQLVQQRAWTPWGKVEFLVSANPDSSVLLGLSRLLHQSIDTEVK